MKARPQRGPRKPDPTPFSAFQLFDHSGYASAANIPANRASYLLLVVCHRLEPIGSPSSNIVHAMIGWSETKAVASEPMSVDN